MNLFPERRQQRLPAEIKRRLAGGLIISLLLHALVLSLQFGLPGLGLPELGAPWNKRRAQAPEISLRIANMPAAAAPMPTVPQPVVAVPPASVLPAPVPGGIRLLALAPATAPPLPQTVAKNNAPPRKAPVSAPAPRKLATPDAPRVIAQDVVRDDSFVMAVPDPDEPKKKSEAETEAPQARDDMTQAGFEQEAEQKKIESAAQQRAQQLEAQQREQNEELARQQAEQLAAQQQQLARQLEQASRQQAAALALQKQLEVEARQRRADQEAARNETLRLAEQLRLEENRRQQELHKEQLQREQLQREQVLKQQQIALEQEQHRQAEARAAEVARQQAAELARQQAEQQAAQARAEQAAARQRAEQLAQQTARELALAQAQTASAGSGSMTDPGEHGGSGDKPTSFVLPRSLLSSDLASRAQEQARAMDLLRGTPPRSDAEQKPRRRSILGNLDKDVPLRMYVDSWKQKIERNGNLNYSQLAKDRARGDPVVTVAIRSDGSVEEITINRSSGRADLDEAVRRIVRLNARYAAFPPNIAAQYDVIEIRRVWNFDEVLRIVEEMR